MSRIIQAINSMIINRDLITDVIAYNDEYFFNFLDYVWSIKRNGPRFVASRGVHLGITQKSYPLTYGYVLTFYPGYTSVSNLKSDLSQKKTLLIPLDILMKRLNHKKQLNLLKSCIRLLLKGCIMLIMC